MKAIKINLKPYAIALGIFTVSLGGCGTKYPQDFHIDRVISSPNYKSSDLMPDPELGTFIRKTIVVKTESGKLVAVRTYVDAKDGLTLRYETAHLICISGIHSPFIIADLQQKKVLLDNRPNDRRIDEVVDGIEARDLEHDVPNC